MWWEGVRDHKLSDFPKEENDLCWKGGLVSETWSTSLPFLPVFDCLEGARLPSHLTLLPCGRVGGFMQGLFLFK